MFRRGYTINQKLRAAVLERDKRCCRKCGRREYLDVHHIAARADGGSDDPENLITLCRVCHMEWHMVEAGATLPFDRWLELPTYNVLLSAYLASEGEYRRAVDIAWMGLRAIE